MSQNQNHKKKKLKRVFIVEDDPMIETKMRHIIKSYAENVEIEWVTNAEEALYRLRDARATLGREYDLIVADVFLDGSSTGIDLWELCQRDYPDTPMILTSGMSPFSFYRTIGENRIGPPFLAKPFTVGECRQLMEDYLEDDREVYA